nr:LysR substrate-binding domain-containing protein [Silvania confinis]
MRAGFATLESACEAFRGTRHLLRLKSPSTLTVNWLLKALHGFHEDNSTPQVQVSSVWMDIDRVEFRREAFDCAILLGNGPFGENTRSLRLFEELLAPVCAPWLVENARQDLTACTLIHPSVDRRDWRRWLQGSELESAVNLSKGHLFDTLEQGNQAAIGGHGVSVGDVALSLNALESGLLALPFSRFTRTGDSYYLVWPADSSQQPGILRLGEYLLARTPDVVHLQVQ